MPRTPGNTAAQLPLPFDSEIVRAGQLGQFNANTRVTVHRAMDIVSGVVTFSPEPLPSHYGYAEPHYLWTGLIIHPGDERYSHGRHLIYSGVPYAPPLPLPNKQPDHKDHAVVFPEVDFSVIARSPTDLGRHSINTTGKAQKGQPDREKTSEDELRSAGHTLESYIVRQKAMTARLWEEAKIFRGLKLDVLQPNPQAGRRRRAAVVDAERGFFDEKLHDTAELALINQDLTNRNEVVRGVHRAIKRNLYSGPNSRAKRAFAMAKALKLLQFHNEAMLHKIAVSQAAATEELQIYQPALDREKERLSAIPAAT